MRLVGPRSPEPAIPSRAAASAVAAAPPWDAPAPSTGAGAPLSDLVVPHGASVPPGSTLLGPLRPGDQGVSLSEAPYAAKATDALLRAHGVQWVATYVQADRQYEVRGREGTLRFERYRTPDDQLAFRVASLTGRDPVPSTDPHALETLEQEVAAAGGPGLAVPPDRDSYPDLLRRVAQLFDHPRAPDLAYVPFPGGDPNHPSGGSHGIPDAVQSRAPLVVAGPTLARGVVSDIDVRNVDVAPTIAQALGVERVIGTSPTGSRREQWLRWQDGRSLARDLVAVRGTDPTATAKRAVVFVFDGGGQNVLADEAAKGNLPNIAWLMARGTTFRHGSISEWPTVTWANHHTLLSGASPGHTGIVNNSWYDRETGREQLITDGGFRNSLRTGRLEDPQVETLYEAVHRSFPGATSASLNEPSGRGATVAPLELRGIGRTVAALPGTLTRYLRARRAERTDPLQADHEYHKQSRIDSLGTALGARLLAGHNPPKLSVFELELPDNQGHLHGPQSPQARAAMQEADRNVGRVLDELRRRDLLDSTLLVLTADHGMGTQWPEGGGGWKEALAASGVKTVESTRFVYVKNVGVALESGPLRPGVDNDVVVRVRNDDVDAAGAHPVVRGATVELTDASGRTWTATTGRDGAAHLRGVRPTGAVTARVRHADFSDAEQTLPVAAG